MHTSLALGLHFEDFIKKQLDGGNFIDASDVVRAGLRLLEDQLKLRALKATELKAAIRAGMVSGSGVPGEEALDRLEQKYTAMATGATG